MYFFASVIVVGLLFPSGDGQSPCPGTFDYQNDELGIHGVIRLQPNGPVSSVTTRVNFTIAARLISNYVGQLKPIDEDQALQRFNQGSQLVYRVHFPVTSPLPKLTSLVVNNREICYGAPDYPAPGQYISTISLQHMLYLRSGSPNSVYPYEPSMTYEKSTYPYQQPETYQQPVTNQQPTYNKPGGFYDNASANGLFSGPISISGLPANPNSPAHQTFTLQGNNGASYTLVLNRTQGQFGPNGERNYNVFLARQTTTPAPAQYYPSFTENPVRNQGQQPPPDFNPYETERPRRPEPQRPRPQAPAPDYNPYETTKRPSFYPYNPDQISRPDPASNPELISQSTDCGVIAGGNERLPLIYGGQTYERGNWPWLVALFRQKSTTLTFICAGTLISKKHVVTAAHCMQQKNTKTSTQDIVVKVGVYNVKDWGDDITQTRTLASAVIHERYNSSTLANDILVLTLDRAVEFNNNIRAACLWTGKSDQSRIVGASGVVAGWGNSELASAGEGDPKMVRLPVVSTATCRSSRPEYHKITTDNTFCAGDRNGAGPCLGDSGGGLYIIEGGRWRLRGVVSLSLRPENGDDTCNLKNYIVFTDAAKYDKWIRDIVQASLF